MNFTILNKSLRLLIPTIASEKHFFAVFTNEYGTGKTTIIRKLRDTLDASRFELMYLADSKITPRHFY